MASLTPRDLWSKVVQTAMVSGMVLFVVGAARLLGWVLAVLQVPQSRASSVVGMGGGQAGFMVLTILIFLPLGAILEGVPAVVLLTPILLPLARELGIDPVHYGTVIVATQGISVFLPPVGVSLLVPAPAGLDVKYGVTENLTADLTLNTDFAQVEVDEQQANLTRFNLFFPEKREFFLESQGIFEFGNGGRGEGTTGGGGPPGSSSVSSSGRGRGARSVHAPTLFYSRRIGLQDGAPVPILGGGRVTGKIGSFDVGAVGIRTGAENSVGADPATFTVLRLRRDLLARSSVGVLFEDRSTSLTSATGRNRAYGADANFAFLENLQIFGYYARTETAGLRGKDDSFRTRIGWRGDLWSASVDHTVVGEDFNPEIGFLRRRGFRETNLFGRASPRLVSVPSIRRLTLAGRVTYLENERFGFVETRQQGVRIEVEFESGDWLTINATDVFERLSGETRISGAVIPAGAYPFKDAEVSYYLGPHRRISGNVSLTRGSFYSGAVTSLGLARGRVEILPQLSVEPSIELNWIDLPELQEHEGQFDQHVLRTRVTYSLGPRTFVSGLGQYNTASDTFSTNVRLRWEWAPGSELFIVYTEDRDADTLDRWSELSARALVIKVNRLLRF